MGWAKTEHNGEEGSLSAALKWGYTRRTHPIPAAASVLFPRRCPLLCLSSLNRLYATYAKLDGWRNRLASHPFNLSRRTDPSPANTRYALTYTHTHTLAALISRLTDWEILFTSLSVQVVSRALRLLLFIDGSINDLNSQSFTTPSTGESFVTKNACKLIAGLR